MNVRAAGSNLQNGKENVSSAENGIRSLRSLRTIRAQLVNAAKPAKS